MLNNAERDDSRSEEEKRRLADWRARRQRALAGILRVGATRRRCPDEEDRGRPFRLVNDAFVADAGVALRLYARSKAVF